MFFIAWTLTVLLGIRYDNEMAVLAYRDILRRIRAAQKTQQITKTMQMVAASRLKKAHEKFVQSKPYLEGITAILGDLQNTDAVIKHPLLTQRALKTVMLVIVTSDRGLCGTYNTNIIHMAETFLNQHQNVELVIIGKKGDDYFKKRRWPIFKRYLDIAGKTDFVQISQITEVLTNAYLSGRFDAIYMASTLYKSAMSIRPELLTLFPILIGEEEHPVSPSHKEHARFARDPSPVPHGGFGRKTYLEPSGEVILDNLLRIYVASKVYVSLLEAATSENSARMIAMKNATDNAHEMINHLTLLRNKARQGTITKELLEMVTAGEALRN